MANLFHVDNVPAYYTSRPPAYQALEFEYLAQGPVEHSDPEDPTDPTLQTVFLRLHRMEGDLDARDVSRLISRAVSPARCYCEHDCCGHRHGWADVRILGFDVAMAIVRTSRNY